MKKVLFDTMVLCCAHDGLSLHCAKASLLLRAGVNGLIRTYVSYKIPFLLSASQKNPHVQDVEEGENCVAECVVYQVDSLSVNVSYVNDRY